MLTRVESFVSDNRSAILAGAAIAVAAGGAGYYLYSSKSRMPSGDAEKGLGKKKKTKSPKKKKVGEEDGPLLEEVVPKPKSGPTKKAPGMLCFSSSTIPSANKL